jgi:CobQ-like glutamine amidotransferase family enzyme
VGAGLLGLRAALGWPACDGPIVCAASAAPDAGWSCVCGFSRPQPDARLVGDELLTADGRRLPLGLLLPGRANRANAVMAAVAAGVLGVDEADALEAMARVGAVEGRFATVNYGGVDVRLLLAKNPAGWTELLDMLEGGTDPVVIGINARIADGHDPSWLWDVDFERLAGRVVVATGDRRRDLAVRLRYAGVAHMPMADPLGALKASGAARVECVGNYTAFQDLRRLLSAAGRGPRPSTSSVAPAATDNEAMAALVPAHPVPVPTTDSPETAPDAGAGRASGGARRRGGAGPSALRVVVIYPDLLGTYGDGGNGRILACRAAWRGLPVELVMAPSDRPLPQGADLYCVGGGEDGPQIQAAERLGQGALAAAVTSGATVLAVCAGYQIVGRSFPGPDGRRYRGVGLLDVETVKGTGRRCVGELVSEPGPDGVDTNVGGVAGRGAVRLDRLTGFENHAGVTTLGPSASPLGRIIAGVGNGAGSGTDGARAGRVIGTYLHGPVLARNPHLADLLLELATGAVPEPLDDEEEQALHDERLQAGSGRGPTPATAAAAWRRLVRARRS